MTAPVGQCRGMAVMTPEETARWKAAHAALRDVLRPIVDDVLDPNPARLPIIPRKLADVLAGRALDALSEAGWTPPANPERATT